MSKQPSVEPEGVVSPERYIEASSAEDAEQKFRSLEKGELSTQAVKYGPCTLYPSKIYLRASSNYGAVGAKPYTKCTRKVSSIRHTTDLRYKSFVWWKLAKSKRGGNQNERNYTQRSVEYYCKSKEKSGWKGTTGGTITDTNGKTYYARVYQSTQSLKCGGLHQYG